MPTKPKESTELSIVSLEGFVVVDQVESVTAVLAANMDGEGLSEFDLTQVKVPGAGGTIWSVPGLTGDEDCKELVGVIAYVGKRRAYWEGADPTGDPPDCHSKDMIRGIGNPGGVCEVCPKNEFGSARNERGKACKELRALFILRQGDRLPIVVVVPPGSLKAFKTYMYRLPVPYYHCLSSLSLKKVTNKDGVAYAEIQFAMVGSIQPDVIPRIEQYAESLRRALA